MCQGHRRFLGLSRRQTVRSRKQTHPATAGPSACACPAALNQAADTTPKSQNRPTTGLVRAGPDPAAVATTFAPIATDRPQVRVMTEEIDPNRNKLSACD